MEKIHQSLANILMRKQRVPFESGDFGENGTFYKNGEYLPKSLQKWSMFKSEILKRFES